MSIVILIAPTTATATLAWATLRQADLADAVPSRREQHTPQQVQEIMLKMVQQRRGASLAPASTAPHATRNTRMLDKIWTELAADLLLANLDAPRFGWHQTLDAHTPGFWQRFDPHIRFVLVYENPAQFVAHNLIQHDPTIGNSNTPDDDYIQPLLKAWHASHSTLLDTFYALGSDAVLVHTDQIGSATALLGLSDRALPSPAPTQQTAYGAALLTQLMHPLVKQDAQANALWQVLQAAAQAPMAVPAQDAQTALHNVNACLQLKTGLLAAQQELNAARQQASSLQDELASAKQALQAEAAAKATALEELASSQKDITRMAEQHRQQVQELTEEGNLLVSQLDQVQEELEHYFVQYQEQKKQLHSITQFWRQHSPTELWVDLRRTDDGNGWYEAESDGRWSGPGTECFVDLSALAAGVYIVELHISDAMAPELVADMLLFAQEADGQTFPLELMHEFGTAAGMFPMISAGIIQIPVSDKAWRLKIVLPKVICPAENGGGDNRKLGLRMQGIRLTLQQPPSPEELS